MRKVFLLAASILLLSSCQMKTEVDAIYFNAKIYAVDSAFTVADAMAVKDGKIVFAGKKDVVFSKFNAKEKTDLQGKFVYPGLIDAHCHFVGYGLNLLNVDLQGTQSWQEVLKRTKDFAVQHPNGWITGRGWDQNDWTNENFPTNDSLNKLFPDRPVFLKRIDGHACIVNQKALDLAHITASRKISGGEIILQNGHPTGVLIDNARDSVEVLIPKPDEQIIVDALLAAQKNCFAVGLTTVDDAGIPDNIGNTKKVVDIIDSLQRAGALKMRFYMMVYDEPSQQYYLQHGTFKTDRLSVRAFKFFADGALGSFGALLLQPYADAPDKSGSQLNPTEYYLQHAQECYDAGFQMCTHAIGDSANRMMLHIYAEVLKGKNDLRWRIEHCQVVNENDFHFFSDYNIIPSVQPTHATSDMYWAKDRLGAARITGAYAYQKLLLLNGWLANGSDFPVEDINPLFGFYAAVTRKDQKGFPEGGFQIQDALTREQALCGMTIWAARSNFEEHEKGSLEPDKFADFVVLDNDLMTAPDDSLFAIKVLATYVDGVKVY